MSSAERSQPPNDTPPPYDKDPNSFLHNNLRENKEKSCIGCQNKQALRDDGYCSFTCKLTHGRSDSNSNSSSRFGMQSLRNSLGMHSTSTKSPPQNPEKSLSCNIDGCPYPASPTGYCSDAHLHDAFRKGIIQPCKMCNSMPRQLPHEFCSTTCGMEYCRQLYTQLAPGHDIQELVLISAPVFNGIRCDVCDQSPMTGSRYKCTVCADFDICGQCRARGFDTRHGHSFVQLAPGERYIRPTDPRVQAPSSPQPLVHDGITCDRCMQFPLKGVRFHCKVCPDFDLCEACACNGATETHGHSFSYHNKPVRLVIQQKPVFVTTTFTSKPS